jgi:hypothetical protein
MRELKAKLESIIDKKLHHKDGSFIVTIGEYGIIIALQKDGFLQKKLFIKTLTNEDESSLKALFKANENLPIYVLLDTAEQSYRKKDYPFIKKHDVKFLIKRDMKNDKEKDSLKSFFFINNSNNKNKHKRDQKWHCLFVSASISSVTKKLLNLLNTMPNHLIGIYMLAIESASLFKTLKIHSKELSKRPGKKNDIYCLISQSKSSGVRQTVFFEDQIIFTRLLDYNCNDVDFAQKYEQDLYATSEYLKRLFPEINISDLETINILPKETIEKINNLNDSGLEFINYTPFEAAKICCPKLKISQNSQVCDLLFSISFANSRQKILKFQTEEIKKINHLFLGSNTLYFINLILVAFMALYFLIAIMEIDSEETAIETATRIHNLAKENLSEATNKILDRKTLISKNSQEKIEIDRIIDFGKINEHFEKYDGFLLKNYAKLRFVRDYPILFDRFYYEIPSYQHRNISMNDNFKIALVGKILNKSGDIEDLFSEFDGINSAFNKNFKDYKVTNSEIPKNIDFTKKYYDYNLNIIIEGEIK